MKYHGHEIKRIPMDLGENDPKKNCIYQIFKDGIFVNEALTLGTAKEYIDSGYNENYI